MNEERIKSRPYLKPLLLAALPGIVSALLTFLFMTVVKGGSWMANSPCRNPTL
jgi:hypothetical protein